MQFVYANIPGYVQVKKNLNRPAEKENPQDHIKPSKRMLSWSEANADKTPTSRFIFLKELFRSLDFQQQVEGVHGLDSAK